MSQKKYAKKKEILEKKVIQIKQVLSLSTKRDKIKEYFINKLDYYENRLNEIS